MERLQAMQSLAGGRDWVLSALGKGRKVANVARLWTVERLVIYLCPGVFVPTLGWYLAPC